MKSSESSGTRDYKSVAAVFYHSLIRNLLFVITKVTLRALSKNYFNVSNYIKSTIRKAKIIASEMIPLDHMKAMNCINVSMFFEISFSKSFEICKCFDGFGRKSKQDMVQYRNV